MLKKCWKNGILPSWNEMLRILVPVNFNPGWGWILSVSLIFKNQKEGWGSWSQRCSQCKTNGDNSSSITWDRHSADCKGAHLSSISASPSQVPSVPPDGLYRIPRTRKNRGYRNHHYSFFLESSHCPEWQDSGYAFSTRPAVLTPWGLHFQIGMLLDSVLWAVLSPLPCQLSWNLSLQFSWLDLLRLYNQICAEVQATPTRGGWLAHIVLNNVLLNKWTF